MKATRQTTPTPDLDATMTPADLLRGAAVYLQQHGWTRHQFFDMTADTAGPFPPACASGAIMTAATGRSLATGMLVIDGDDTAEAIAAIRAMRVFAAWIDLEYTANDGYGNSAIDVIGDWNDFADRTLNEVIEALTDAANEWDTIHHTGGAR
ncbi:DUF6197 family protein [Actinoplanes sp. CA-252034]|uniref:DUF6197 family protein n=1 Tax=Actinoplanes sp. CA-252034 TaxID=3239906 RepID=UPI003D982B91